MKKNKNRSALEEKEGILTSNSLNTASISKIKRGSVAKRTIPTDVLAGR